MTAGNALGIFGHQAVLILAELIQPIPFGLINSALHHIKKGAHSSSFFYVLFSRKASERDYILCLGAFLTVRDSELDLLAV
jgi:hypothetical protein